LLEQSGGDHALGFSSIEAYALERCERSASWTQKARGLARRLERLPVIEDALISGSLSWSMAAVLATVASPDDAELWLAEAARRTVREMKALVLERRGAVDEVKSLEAEEELRTLTLTVSREDAWCFEQAKLLGRHMGEGTHADVVFGLVAESTGTLCSELPNQATQLADDNSMDPQRAWEAELARMRAEAEVRCESHFRRGRGSAKVLPPSDAEVRRVEDLERAVVTGQMSAPPASPASVAAPANVTLRLRVHASTARDFRHWEAIYLRHRGSALGTTTFLRFACELFIDTWRPRRAEVEYAHIYQRDRYCCRSPCCGRRDVTPHHLRFRSHGGDDSPRT
jgi:hypothetical protein